MGKILMVDNVISCYNCHKYFQRPKPQQTVKSTQICRRYVWEHQTISALASDYKYSNKWLKKTDITCQPSRSGLESLNSRMRELLHIHRGFGKSLKQEIISEILEN